LAVLSFAKSKYYLNLKQFFKSTVHTGIFISIVKFAEPPSVVRGPEDKKCDEGGNASMECSVKGKPTPVIHWLLNGNIINNDTHARVYGKRLVLILLLQIDNISES